MLHAGRTKSANLVNSMFKASESPYAKIEVLKTSLSKLDSITGIGGIPSRKITEISGVYSVGKTTLALSVVSSALKEGKECLWTDTEFQFDPLYAEKLGVELTQLDLVQEQYAEDTLDAVEKWATEHKNSLIVIDSIGQLLPRAEAEKTADGKVIGGQARLVAVFCRKIVPIIAINNIALVVLNHQITDLMTGRLKTGGGAKLEYAKSLHIMLRKMPKRVMKGENQIGDVIEAEIRKNKLAATLHQKAELILLYGEGFSAEADKLQEMLDSGEVTKKGNSYFYKGEKVAVGQTKAREWVKSL